MSGFAATRHEQQSLESFYQEILESAPWGAIVASTRIDGRCLYLNREFSRITGYVLEDIPTVFDWIQLAYPDPAYREDVVSNWPTDTSPEQMHRDVVYRVHCKDGNTKSIQFRAGLLAPDRMVVMLLDVTRRDQAEQALRDSEERYRQLVETSPVGIVVHTGEVLDFANPAAAQIIGASSPDAICGKPVLDFVHPDYHETVRARMRGILESGRLGGLEEERFIRLDGTVIDVEVSGAPIQYRGTVAAQVVFNDITERKRLERERLALERRIQQTQRTEGLALLAGGVAHDLNNLLVGILGHAELARLPDRTQEDVDCSLEAIIEVSQRATDLAGQLLAFAGRRPLEFALIDLNRLVSQTQGLLEAQIGRRARLTLDCQAPLPPIEGDSTQIRQILVNLVSNAADAVKVTDGDGRIGVATRLVAAAGTAGTVHSRQPSSDGPRVLIEVVDDGIGMDEDTRRRVFDPFFTTKRTGQGLGLAAVLGIVRAHHGAIDVESRPGRGTTFRVSFPAAIGRQPEASLADDEVEADCQGRGTVLLVDDEALIRKVGSAMIREIGLEVVVAESGEEAIERLRQEPSRYAAVILDLTMPGWSGERTLQAIRAVHPELPVVISSGYDQADTAHKLGDAAPAAFLRKPYTLAEVARTLCRVLG